MTSTGERTCSFPVSSKRVQPQRAVPDSVTVVEGAASPPAAIFQKIATRAWAVLLFPTVIPVFQPAGAVIAVTEVIAAAVTTMTSRSPAVRGWVPDQVLVALPVAVIYAVAVGVPTWVTATPAYPPR